MNGNRKIRHSFRQTTIMIFLVALLIFVLLPMGWMIITAFRTPGTAFRLDLIPDTRLVAPEMQEQALPIASVPEGSMALHLEYVDPRATSVEAEYRFAGDPQTQTAQMSRSFGGVWFVDLTSDRESCLYRFILNRETTVPDPEAPEDAIVAGGWTRGEFRSGPPELPTDARALVRAHGERLFAQIGADPLRRVSLLLDDEREVRLQQTAKGVFTGEFDLAGAQTWRVVQRRPFGEAFAEMYTAENFRTILTSESFHFGRYFLNSLIVASLAGFLTVILCTLAGYAFAVKEFHFRDRIFHAILASMLIPGMIFMVPQFGITLELGWMNSYQGMIVPHLANVFGLFLLRQYIGQIPRDLFMAAEIDGAGEIQVFRNIVIPVCMPIMVTLFLLTFVFQWSNFLWQLIINTGDSPFLTLPVGLQQFKGQNANEWEKIMAGACFSILPIAALFMALQRYFIQGLTAGAVKE